MVVVVVAVVAFLTDIVVIDSPSPRQCVLVVHEGRGPQILRWWELEVQWIRRPNQVSYFNAQPVESQH